MSSINCSAAEESMFDSAPRPCTASVKALTTSEESPFGSSPSPDELGGASFSSSVSTMLMSRSSDSSSLFPPRDPVEVLSPSGSSVPVSVRYRSSAQSTSIPISLRRSWNVSRPIVPVRTS